MHVPVGPEVTERAPLLVERERPPQRNEVGAQAVDDRAPVGPARPRPGGFAADEPEQRETCRRRLWRRSGIRLCSAWAAEAQSIEPEDALQMSKEHLDLLSLATRDGVGLGLGDRTGLVASGFINGAADCPYWAVWAALGLERAGFARLRAST